jgi:protease-4
MPPLPPQMMPPPPPYFYPPPPQPSRRGGGFVRGVFVTLATTILGASLAMNIYLLLWAGLTSGSAGAQESILVNGDPKQKIAVVSIEGAISADTSKRFDKIMRDVESDGDVKALVLEINTPGGEVTASDEIYQRVLRYKGEKNVKVVASMGGMATSGGYYVACSADYIFAQPTTLTGNIGVVLQRFNFSGLMEKYGVQDTTVTSEGSKFKYSESPFRPETPETAEYLKGIANDIYGRFTRIVKDSRGDRLKGSIDQVADGKAYMADEAKKLGLVDEINYAQAAYDKAASLAGLTKQQVVRFQRTPSFLEALGGAGASSGLSRPEVSVRVDSNLINELRAPKLLYLYRGD